MSSLHKPRRKAKKSSNGISYNIDQNAVALNSKTNAQEPTFTLASFLWPARKGTSQWVILPLVLMVAGLFRWVVSFWGYSGFQTPPMHGDFEAQRHWMEITMHLPISKWYFYDLEYWGLDYPPLTAYHSWLLAIIGSRISPTWFALDASRGIETPNLKLYMRATVLVSEYLVYIPAVIIFNRRFARLCGVNSWESSVALVAILMQPATMIVDHAHFQYNTVMLGFVLASVSSFLAGRRLWGCVFFVAALSFKQMALYFAPAIFAYLLGVCFQPRIDLRRFMSIATVTLASFSLVFAPLWLGSLYNQYQDPLLMTTLEPPALLQFINSSVPIPLDEKSALYPIVLQTTQAIHRIFPLARGLFEDKVANFWCALHTVYKLNRFSIPFLSRVSLLATLVAISPSCLLILIAPKKALLPYALASCAWSFFLCSFQVHEKSVLLPLLPMTMLLGGESGLGSEIRAWVGWANLLGMWTMFPLLKRDELRVPYAVLSLLWSYLVDLPPTSFSLYYPNQQAISLSTKVLHMGSYIIMMAWHAVEAFLPPPDGKPDLWVVLNCVVGAVGFSFCYLWCTWNLLSKSGILDSFIKETTTEAKSSTANNTPGTNMIKNGGTDTKAKGKK